jgi:hypothetical protein
MSEVLLRLARAFRRVPMPLAIAALAIVLLTWR